MFLFTLVKKIIVWILLAGFIFWAANYEWKGKPFYKTVYATVKSNGFKEGMKDVGMFFGGFLKSMGEEIEEHVTEEDQKKLDQMIQKKVKEKDDNR